MQDINSYKNEEKLDEIYQALKKMHKSIIENPNSIKFIAEQNNVFRELQKISAKNLGKIIAKEISLDPESQTLVPKSFV